MTDVRLHPVDLVLRPKSTFLGPPRGSGSPAKEAMTCQCRMYARLEYDRRTGRCLWVTTGA